MGVNANDQCTEYQSFASVDDNVDANYLAIGSFGIVADQSLESYKEYIVDAMMSENFNILFESNFNNALNEKINSIQERRRNLLANHFDAVSIEVHDALNISKVNAEADETLNNEETSNTLSIALVLLGVFALLIIAFVFVLMYRRKQKEKLVEDEEDQMKNGNQIEMNE